MGNAVKLQTADDNADNAILDNFGVDISKLKPGCVVVLIDINGPVAVQANAAGLRGEDSVEVDATTVLCAAFIERVSADDDFCRDLSEWASENVDVEGLGLSTGEVLTEDEEPSQEESVDKDWREAAMNTPFSSGTKKTLH